MVAVAEVMPVARGRSRALERGLSLLEVGIGVSLAGTVLAIAVPSFVRELHGSRFAEAEDGLARISAAAVAYAEGRPPESAFPPAAPLTPAEVPRGKAAVDAEGIWGSGTWKLLDFRPVPEGVAHRFSFAFDPANAPFVARFVARAHADMDGDGTTSEFRMHGSKTADDATIDPGLDVERELE